MSELPDLNRRELIKLIGLMSVVPPLSATDSLGATAPVPAAAPIRITNAASAFNRGKSQVNFNFPGGNVGEYPFINHLKMGSTWKYATGNGPVDPNDHDSNGYPTVIRNGGQYLVTFLPPQSSRPGNYVLTWDGNGTIYILEGNTPVSGSKASTGGRGRYVFSTDATRIALGIRSIGVPHITNMNLYHVADEPDVLAGKIFGAQFKARLREANFGVYRFLNWQVGNGSNLTTWAMRKPVDYVTFGGYELRSSLFAGTTANVGDDYSLTSGTGSPADKQTVILRFNASKTSPKIPVTFSAGSRVNWPAHGLSANDPVGFSDGQLPPPLTSSGNYYVSAVIDANTIQVSATPGGTTIALSGNGSGNSVANRQPTLDLNSTGRKPLKDQSGNTLGTSNSPLAGAYATVVYDAVLGSWLLFGGSSATGDAYLSAGVPPEICVQLCAEMGAHPYFVLPPLAADPLTDFAASLATYIRDNGPSWMIPRFEGVNELWNYAAGFIGTSYASAKASAYGWGPDLHNWMGKVMSVMGQAVSQVYANDRTRYQVICGVQTVVFATLPPFGQDPRLTSAKFVAAGGSAASNWVTHVCCAQYIIPSAYGGYNANSAQENALAAAYAGGDLSAPATYVDTLTTGNGYASLANAATCYRNLATWAAGLGVRKMCGYEGGYSPDYGSKKEVNALRGAGKLVPALQDYTATNYRNFLAAGGEFPSCFQLAGPTPSSNVWSVLEDIYQNSPPPQWRAIVAFNNKATQPQQ